MKINKIKDHHKLVEVFMETVLGPENFEKMLMSIDNDAIMGRSMKSIQNKTHRRRISNQNRVPKLDGEKILEQFSKDGTKTNREINPKNFKHVLHEFEKNRQNIISQNKIMDDIQRKMDSFGKEFNIRKGAASALELDSASYTLTPNTNHLTNFVPKSNRSSDIRAHARAESEGYMTQRQTLEPTSEMNQDLLETKRSLPVIHER